MRRLALLALVATLAACSDSSGPGDDRLNPEPVGAYCGPDEHSTATARVEGGTVWDVELMVNYSHIETFTDEHGDERQRTRFECLPVRIDGITASSADAAITAAYEFYRRDGGSGTLVR